MQWPAQSPNLNVIENIWQQVYANHRKRAHKPNNMYVLFSVLEEWKFIGAHVV